jgi:hypothetical protein
VVSRPKAGAINGFSVGASADTATRPARCTAPGLAYAAQTLAVGGLNTINVADGMTGWAVAGRPMISEDGAEPYVA